MTSPSTQGKKVVLYDRVTGDRFERWPVDAREMLATGAYQLEPLAVAEESIDPDALTAATGVPAGVDTPDPVPHVTQADALATAQSPTGAPLVLGDVVAVTTGVTEPARSTASTSKRK